MLTARCKYLSWNLMNYVVLMPIEWRLIGTNNGLRFCVGIVDSTTMLETEWLGNDSMWTRNGNKQRWESWQVAVEIISWKAILPPQDPRREIPRHGSHAFRPVSPFKKWQNRRMFLSQKQFFISVSFRFVLSHRPPFERGFQVHSPVELKRNYLLQTMRLDIKRTAVSQVAHGSIWVESGSWSQSEGFFLSWIVTR